MITKNIRRRKLRTKLKAKAQIAKNLAKKAEILARFFTNINPKTRTDAA